MLCAPGVSRDGTARLWDCGTQKTLAVLHDTQGHAINQCDIVSTDAPLSAPAERGVCASLAVCARIHPE